MSYHFQFVATATAQALTMLEAKEIDREALRRLLTNLHAFASNQIAEPCRQAQLKARTVKVK